MRTKVTKKDLADMGLKKRGPGRPKKKASKKMTKKTSAKEKTQKKTKKTHKKSTPKSDAPMPIASKSDWSVFVSDVPAADKFLCILMRRDVDTLAEADKNEVYRICELLQSCVVSVRLTTSINGTVANIVATNLEDPCTDSSLWTQIHKLIGPNASSYMEIRNLDSQGNDQIVEKYELSDIVVSIERCYGSNGVQTIDINGLINKEFITE